MDNARTSVPWEEVPLREALTRSRLDVSVAGLRLRLRELGVCAESDHVRLDLLASSPVRAELPAMTPVRPVA